MSSYLFIFVSKPHRTGNILHRHVSLSIHVEHSGALHLRVILKRLQSLPQRKIDISLLIRLSGLPSSIILSLITQLRNELLILSNGVVFLLQRCCGNFKRLIVMAKIASYLAIVASRSSIACWALSKALSTLATSSEVMGSSSSSTFAAARVSV